MQTLICLVRHGVTEWNYEGRAQGRTDIPLNAEGLQQAEAVAARLSRERWAAIYSSPLSRASRTAAAIARLTGHAVQHDPRLMERDMSVAEGSTEFDRSMRWPGIHFKAIPGVESDEAMADRATGVLREFAKRHPGQRVICVAHGGLIRAFCESLSRPEGTPALRISPGNTSVARIEYGGDQFTVQAPPDHNHLLVDGIDLTGEKGRIQFSGLKDLATLTGIPADRLEAAVALATAVESAWVRDRLVGFARVFTDGAVAGYVDLVTAAPEHRHVIPLLLQRLENRFPGVPLVTLQQQAGD